MKFYVLEFTKIKFTALLSMAKSSCGTKMYTTCAHLISNYIQVIRENYRFWDACWRSQWPFCLRKRQQDLHSYRLRWQHPSCLWTGKNFISHLLKIAELSKSFINFGSRMLGFCCCCWRNLCLFCWLWWKNQCLGDKLWR